MNKENRDSASQSRDFQAHTGRWLHVRSLISAIQVVHLLAPVCQSRFGKLATGNDSPSFSKFMQSINALKEYLPQMVWFTLKKR